MNPNYLIVKVTDRRWCLYIGETPVKFFASKIDGITFAFETFGVIVN
jgi:hypothetical protein